MYRLRSCWICTLLILSTTVHLPAADDNSVQREAYLQYAMQNSGDSQQGEQLFLNHQKLQCTNCHRITGMEKSGPNLEGVGDKFNKQQLIRQVLFPSEELKPGYEQVTILAKNGRVHVGRLERANQTVYRLIDAQGKQANINPEDVEEVKQSNVSLMPENLVAAITQEEFAHLIAYLQTLSYGVQEGLVAGGKSVPITRLSPAVNVRPIHDASLKFENPAWCGTLPGTDSDLLVVEHQTSKIWRVIRQSDRVEREIFLDLGQETFISNNQGLMCVTFHPQFKKNRLYYVEYEVKEGDDVKTTVAERVASADGLTDSGQPSRRLLEVKQPAFNHNGGCIEFGPDGMLYAGFGDGGPQKDPNGYSQNPREFLGSMIRIDVDQRDSGLPYGIPKDNPFWQQHREDRSIRPEIWAIGFREPWRFSFDPKTGELYVGDVGQNLFEEVSIVKKGENHGWNVREAFADFSDEYRRKEETFVDPIFAYKHGLGFSVTGGHVYRGAANPSFDGIYIFGDYNTRRIWGLRQSAGKVTHIHEIGEAPGGIASFGIDQRGEVFLVTYMGSLCHVDLSDVEFPR